MASAATGQLNQPAWPNVPGMDAFGGKLFHSARWDTEPSINWMR